MAITDSFTEVLTLADHTDLDKSWSEVHWKSVVLCIDEDSKESVDESMDCHGKSLEEPEMSPGAVYSCTKVWESGTLETAV